MLNKQIFFDACPCGRSHLIRRSQGLTNVMDVYHPWFQVQARTSKGTTITMIRGADAEDAEKQYIRDRVNGFHERFTDIEVLAVVPLFETPEEACKRWDIEDGKTGKKERLEDF